jgi:hypothetical protein
VRRFSLADPVVSRRREAELPEWAHGEKRKPGHSASVTPAPPTSGRRSNATTRGPARAR